MKVEIFNHRPSLALVSELISHPTGGRGMDSEDFSFNEGKNYIIDGDSVNDIFVLLGNDVKIVSSSNDLIEHDGNNKFHLTLDEYLRVFGTKNNLIKTHQITPQSLEDVMKLDEILEGHGLYGSYPQPTQVNNIIRYQPIYVDQTLHLGSGDVMHAVRFMNSNRIMINSELANALTGNFDIDQYA